MLKPIFALAVLATVAGFASTAPAHAAGKRIRVDNAVPPPVVNVTPTYSRYGKPVATPDVSNAPGGVAVHINRRRW